MKKIETSVPRNKGVFSKERFESCMMSSHTSFDQLKELTGYDIKMISSSKDGMPLEVLNDCCLIMQCDPKYILMLNNDPKIGSYKVKPSKIIKETEMETNKLNKERIKSLIKEQEMTNSVFTAMIGMPSYSLDSVLNKKLLYSNTITRIAWVLATSVEYINGETDDRYSNPATSRIPDNCNFKFNGLALDYNTLLCKKCGLSLGLIHWLTTGVRMIPKSLATKIASGVGKNYWEFQSDKNIPDKDEPLNIKNPTSASYQIIELKAKAQEVFDKNYYAARAVLQHYLSEEQFNINNLFDDLNLFFHLDIEQIYRKTQMTNYLLRLFGLRIYHIVTGEDTYQFAIINRELFDKNFAADYDTNTFVGIHTIKRRGSSATTKTAKKSSTSSQKIRKGKQTVYNESKEETKKNEEVNNASFKQESNFHINDSVYAARFVCNAVIYNLYFNHAHIETIKGKESKDSCDTILFSPLALIDAINNYEYNCGYISSLYNHIGNIITVLKENKIAELSTEYTERIGAAKYNYLILDKNNLKNFASIYDINKRNQILFEGLKFSETTKDSKSLSAVDIMDLCGKISDDKLDSIVNYIDCLKNMRKIRKDAKA